MSNRAEYWDSTKDINEFQYTETTKMIVKEMTKKGRTYIDIRKWYIPTDSADGMYLPGKGVCIDKTKLSPLLSILINIK